MPKNFKKGKIGKLGKLGKNASSEIGVWVWGRDGGGGDDGQASVDISIYYPMWEVTFISSLTLK